MRKQKKMIDVCSLFFDLFACHLIFKFRFRSHFRLVWISPYPTLIAVKAFFNRKF